DSGRLYFYDNGDFRYICHIRDYFTRYSWARVLTSKRPIKCYLINPSYAI
ncbi:19830_t:CDS:2, partial [Racocetra persica]